MGSGSNIGKLWNGNVRGLNPLTSKMRGVYNMKMPYISRKKMVEHIAIRFGLESNITINFAMLAERTEQFNYTRIFALYEKLLQF